MLSPSSFSNRLAAIWSHIHVCSFTEGVLKLGGRLIQLRIKRPCTDHFFTIAGRQAVSSFFAATPIIKAVCPNEGWTSGASSDVIFASLFLQRLRSSRRSARTRAGRQVAAVTSCLRRLLQRHRSSRRSVRTRAGRQVAAPSSSSATTSSTAFRSSLARCSSGARSDVIILLKSTFT